MTVISVSNSVSDVAEGLTANRRTVAMFGGTFDPIHHAHLRLALELRDRLAFDQVLLLPCALPTHRESPGCSADQRLEMVRLAVGDEPKLQVDDRELLSDEPSYSYHSLLSLRQQLGDDVSLTMVMGADALLKLDSWYRWQELLELGHILVVSRPGWHLTGDHPLADWVDQHRVENFERIQNSAAGGVYIQQLPGLDISATAIRQLIEGGSSPRYLLPDPVFDWIKQNHLYTGETQSKTGAETSNNDG
ncbi:MAG: nicotinate-nucleotide adenylyltransferase [Motiliproteus sp.]